MKTISPSNAPSIPELIELMKTEADSIMQILVIHLLIFLYDCKNSSNFGSDQKINWMAWLRIEEGLRSMKILPKIPLPEKPEYDDLPTECETCDKQDTDDLCPACLKLENEIDEAKLKYDKAMKEVKDMRYKQMKELFGNYYEPKRLGMINLHRF